MQDEVWTVGRLLSWTADYLKKHGSDSPRLDAEVLLAHSLGCERIELYTRFDEQPADEQRSAFRDFVRRRAEGMPVAYLVGHREFFSLSFRVTEDVLIPRPETEHLVVAAIDLARQVKGPASVCDVGTGSGIIAVCLAHQVPQCRVTAVDISPAAVEIARQNAAAHEVAQRIEFVQGDLLENLPTEPAFDLILSNPPYVADGETDQMAAETRRFEPRQALFAGPKGTEVIERLVPQASERLKPNGHLLLEISPMIHQPVRDILAGDERLDDVQTVKDLAGHERVVVARRR
ncbi:MAG: peptide chain release factor N(5)-glutamine methyltransferase [Planctomycetaceae bacterium]|nr:peptide chain release factor N(5)-glutamine methyltransferase [Planctomycetaceae bacterium]